jgi:hypothetical protein
VYKDHEDLLGGMDRVFINQFDYQQALSAFMGSLIRHVALWGHLVIQTVAISSNSLQAAHSSGPVSTDLAPRIVVVSWSLPIR